MSLTIPVEFLVINFHLKDLVIEGEQSGDQSKLQQHKVKEEFVLLSMKWNSGQMK